MSYVVVIAAEDMHVVVGWLAKVVVVVAVAACFEVCFEVLKYWVRAHLGLHDCLRLLCYVPACLSLAAAAAVRQVRTVIMCRWMCWLYS